MSPGWYSRKSWPFSQGLESQQVCKSNLSRCRVIERLVSFVYNRDWVCDSSYTDISIPYTQHTCTSHVHVMFMYIYIYIHAKVSQPYL